MEERRKENKARIIEKGMTIFSKGQPVTQIMVLLKGTVKKENSYMKSTLKTGDIIGLTSMEAGKYLFDFVAEEDVTVFPIHITNAQDIKRLFLMGKEYKRYTVSCMVKQNKELIEVYHGLEDVTDKLVCNIQEGYQKYLQLCKNAQIRPMENKELADMQEVIEDNKWDPFMEEYFLNLMETPPDVSNAFFSANEYVAYAHVVWGARLAKSLHDANRRLIKKFMAYFKLYMDGKEPDLFTAYYRLGLEMIEAKANHKEVLREMEKMMVLAFEIKGYIENTLNIPFPLDKKRMNDRYRTLKSAPLGNGSQEQATSAYSKEQIDKAVGCMKDSLKKILAYSEIEKEKAEDFEKKLLSYQKLSDPNTSDDEARKLRREIVKLFYEIYEKVFLKSLKETNENRLVQMFLDFGFMDERMVNEETAIELFFLNVKPREGNIRVYTISQWLKAVYEGKREPSKSTFDMDYREHLRERKKRREITEKEELIYLQDGKMRVRYEIENMFTSNNRVTNGKLSIFCPVLKQADFIGEISRLHLTYDKIEQAIDNVLKIDFSAFHREVMYQDMESNVEKAYIQKQVLPDVILMPNVGENGIMWQEISDRKRDAPGRFILPIFLLRDLDAIMTYMVGCFRWELCRTIQGVYWNDLREKSLTSEYSDYIQFYRKNKDLSEEAKQKLKLQLQKCRNRTREVFAKDYELWIRYEYAGSVRLNKVARAILFTYCPFAKEYREKLSLQPMYQDAVAKYERERQKEVKRIHNMYSLIKGNKGTITPVMEESLRFIEEM